MSVFLKQLELCCMNLKIDELDYTLRGPDVKHGCMHNERRGQINISFNTLYFRGNSLTFA